MEKQTDYILLSEYKNIFEHTYETKNNVNLFGKLIPDGWDIIDDKYLIIIENKVNKTKQYLEGKKQLFNYYEILKDEIKEKYIIYLILCFGTNEETLTYEIFDSKFNKFNSSLKDLYKEICKNCNMKKEDTLIIKNNIHKINQIIYNELNLQNKEKTLFIASILLCLKIDINIFDDVNDNYISQKIIDIIDEHYSDKVFTNIFKFISKSNKNDIIKTIIDKIKLITNRYDTDLLNQFYSEFCKWDKNDDKKFGIVLTPDDIVSLMVTELNVQENDKILDFCTGTGSFLIECWKQNRNKNIKLFGCEYSDERYSLAKCNFILNDIPYNKLIYNSCFNVEYKSNFFDKIIINPPFAMDCKDCENRKHNEMKWTDYCKEQKFIIYALELLKIGGICVAIIPRNNFATANIKSQQQFKETLLNNCKILKIISCNEKVFYPVATVKCSIIVFQKITQTSLKKQRIISIDYTEDGYSISKNKRVKIGEPDPKQNEKEISKDNDWNYKKSIDEEIDVNELNKKILLYNNSYNYVINNMKILNGKAMEQNQLQQIIYIPLFTKDVKIKWNEYKLANILEEVKATKTFQINKTEIGEYPLISSASVNNGISKFINDYSFDGDKNILISISRNGHPGHSFVHNYKFAITADVIVFKLLNKDFNLHLLALLLTNKLTQMFDYSNKLTINKLKEITIKYPF